jgi:hypothetical protein
MKQGNQKICPFTFKHLKKRLKKKKKEKRRKKKEKKKKKMFHQKIIQNSISQPVHQTVLVPSTTHDLSAAPLWAEHHAFAAFVFFVGQAYFRPKLRP